MRRVFVYALLVVAISLISAIVIRWATAPTPDPDILLTRADNPDLGMLALPGGTLEIDLDRGCVLLSGRPVVWPTGTALTTDPPLLQFPGGGTARPGDHVNGGGGAGYAWQIRRTSIGIDGNFERAVDCVPPHTEVIVFNPGSAMRIEPRMLVTHATDVTELDARTMQQGALELDADRECILVGGRPALWPLDTTLTEQPLELRLPSGDTARAGDVVRGRGRVMPASELDRTRMWINGDLDRTLDCVPPGSKVVVFRGPGTRMTVSSGG
jgi:hypothetical protein